MPAFHLQLSHCTNCSLHTLINSCFSLKQICQCVQGDKRTSRTERVIVQGSIQNCFHKIQMSGWRWWLAEELPPSSRNRQANKITSTQLPVCVSAIKVQDIVGRSQVATNFCRSFRGSGPCGTNWCLFVPSSVVMWGHARASCREL